MGKTKTELFQDFSEGIVNLLAPNRLPANALATASNVWYDNGAIKARGAFKAGPTSPLTLTISGSQVESLTIYQNARVLLRSSNVQNTFNNSACSVSGTKVIIYSQNPDSAGDPSFIAVSSGSASTNSTAVVTGSGTTWLSSVKAGDMFVYLGKTQFITVLSVDSDTQVTLSSAYSTTNALGPYYIVPQYTLSYPVSFEKLNNKIYITNSTRTPGIFPDSSSLFTNNSNAPSAHFSKVFKNYMFYANTTANPSRISWSALKDAETWPASNFIDVAPDDGQMITGLYNDGQSLLILKRQSVYKLSGDIFDPSNPTYTLTKILTPPECVFDSAESWQPFNGTTLLYGGTGLYYYEGGNVIARHPVTDKLLTTFTAVGWTPKNYQALELAGVGQQATVYNGSYWITSTEGTVNSPSYGGIVVLDRNMKWWIFSPPNATDITYGFINTPGNSTTVYNILWTYSRNSSTGFTSVYMLDQTYTNESINATFTTKVFEYKNKQRFGIAYLHFKRASTGTINFTAYVDETSTGTDTVDMTQGTGNRAKSQPITIGVVGQSVQFVISHNAATEDFEVYGIEFERMELGV